MREKNPYHQLPDEDLIHRYQNSHDAAYIGELYQRYVHLVYGVCLKYLKDEEKSKDAVMDIFEKLIKDLKRHHVKNFKPWLHTVVKNYCMMEFRNESQTIRKKIELQQSNLLNVQRDMENDAFSHLNEVNEKEWLLEHLHEGINELKEEQRRCIELFYLQGNSYQKISEITGFTLNEVKSHIQNGKRNLKNYIMNKNERQKEE
ncbi:MAG: sigma-70 family RNA polymerase sigma factor [Chitinophagales bacterium]|nr:sigma-70 family RNA polymerase sigma factor [Chitinophagales bacterium]MDW8274136.1 sigma-70 family RNA polymerase sigma factor [Chitinophagales bacterium]